MISIIVGTSENGVIGHLNEIPWYLPRDLKHFANTTRGHACIMGRKTFESILKRLGHPLKDRKNIVITNQKDYKAEGAIVVHSWNDAVAAAEGDEIFVSGGGEIYKLALPHTDRIIHTVIHTNVEGDSFFRFDHDGWNLVSSESHPKDEKNEFDCTFNIYERKK